MTDAEGVRGPSALVGCRARNARSFRGEMDLSLQATNLAEKRFVREVPWREGGQPLRLLPVAGLFGANGSGKSNVLKVMDDMRRLVLASFRGSRPTGGVVRRPFLLDPVSRQGPSSFEIDVVVGGVLHGYGFEVDDRRVLREWASRYPHGREALLFEREGDDISFGPTERGRSRAAAKLLRPNALLLSTAAATNHPTLTGLYAWFERNLLLAEAETRPFRQALTTGMLDDPEQREKVLALLRAADLGITGAVKREFDPAVRDRIRQAMRILFEDEGDPDGEGFAFEELGVRLIHRGAEGDVELDPHEESLGTRVWFGVVGPAVLALTQGSILLADEADASLHPALVAQLVRLFQDPSTNPRRAQLIFNSHDVTLLGDSTSDQLLGRDQIWFTEKLDDGSTRLYPLTDLDPRKEEAVARRYLAGRYGAVPIISDQEFDMAAELITSGDPS